MTTTTTTTRTTGNDTDSNHGQCLSQRLPHSVSPRRHPNEHTLISDSQHLVRPQTAAPDGRHNASTATALHARHLVVFTPLSPAGPQSCPSLPQFAQQRQPICPLAFLFSCERNVMWPTWETGCWHVKAQLPSSSQCAS